MPKGTKCFLPSNLGVFQPKSARCRAYFICQKKKNPMGIVGYTGWVKAELSPIQAFIPRASLVKSLGREMRVGWEWVGR